KDIGVDAIGAEVLERRGKGLPHLRGEIGPRIIRKPVVLASRIRELGLEEEVLTAQAPLAVQRGQRIADRLLEIVAAPVGGIDSAESGPHGRTDQVGRLLLLPRRAVEKGRYVHVTLSPTGS